MAEYDTTFKRLVQISPEAFVLFALGDQAKVEIDEVIETELPRVETRLTDSLIRVRIDGEEALVHTEFQTADSTDSPMPIRMASYIIRLIESHGLPVYSCVIYLRPGAGRRDEGYYEQALPGHRVFVEYKVIRLSEMEGQSILEGSQDGLLPFVPLMKRPAGMGSEDWLRQCIRRIDAGSLDQADKVDFLGSLAVLSGLVYDLTTITGLFSEEGVMDAITQESSFAQYLKEQFREQFLKQGIEQGIEQGKEQFREQFIEQGLRERAVEDILDVLEIRFGPVTADQFADRIAVIDDLQRLKQLHRSAVQVNRLDDFQRLLDAEA